MNEERIELRDDLVNCDGLGVIALIPSDELKTNAGG